MRVGFVRNSGLAALSLCVGALVACNDNPVDYDVDQALDIFVNPSSMVVDAGAGSKLVSQAVNQGLEATRAEILVDGQQLTSDVPCAIVNCVTVCLDPDATSLNPPGQFVVRGGTTLGSCSIPLSTDGASKEVEVTVVAANVVLTCPDSVRAGDSGRITAALVDSAGSTPVSPFDQATDLAWATDSTAIIAIDQSGNWQATQSGGVTVTSTWSGTDGTGTSGLATRQGACVIQVGADVPDSAAFADADSLSNLGVIYLGDPVEPTTFEVFAFDQFGNVNAIPSEVTGITASSSDAAVVTAVATREVLENGEVVLRVEFTPTGAGVATISGVVQTTEGDLPYSGTVEVQLIPSIGASSPEEGLVGEVVTLEVTNYDPASHTVYIDGSPIDEIFIESESATEVVFWMPFTSVGVHEIATGGAPEALSNGVPFNLTSEGSADAPDYENAGTAPLTALPLKKVAYTNPNVLDHFYRIEVGAATTIVIDLDWNSESDLDILVTDGAFTAFVCTDGATGAQPEQSVCDLPAAGEYLIWINNYDETFATYVLEAAAQ
ncbi:MAG: hypothetical protein P8125_01605 [Gemmatimonadota bacterium]|jgi:hypothetical protein